MRIQQVQGLRLPAKALARLKRKMKGQTQAEVSEAAGISQPTLCSILGGRQRALPETLESIAAALGMTVKIRVKTSVVFRPIKKLQNRG